MTAREQQSTAERLRRWRLILGGSAADGSRSKRLDGNFCRLCRNF